MKLGHDTMKMKRNISVTFDCNIFTIGNINTHFKNIHSVDETLGSFTLKKY